MMKTIAFYASVSAMFGMLAWGSVEYTGQFNDKTSTIASKSSNSNNSGPFRLSHGWTKSKK